jgi:hypothetical protein
VRVRACASGEVVCCCAGDDLVVCDVGYCCRRYEPRPEDLTEAQRVTVAMGVPLKVTKSFSSLTALLPEPTAAAAAAAGKKKTKKKTKSKKKNNNKQKQEL